jgi:iron complex transport system ATP-binding protein
MTLEIRDLCFSYRTGFFSNRERPVLRDLSMDLDAGEIGILLGKNGAGKTTLLKNTPGIEKPGSGSVLIDGTDVMKIKREERAKFISYVPQIINFGDLTVYDTVMTGRVSYMGLSPSKSDREAVGRILDDMGLSDLADRSVEKLSGGERQKIAIARALVQEPRLLVFDEPTANLDISNEVLVSSEMTKAARERGVAVLASLHDINQALEIGDRFFFLKDGRVLRSGGQEIISEELIEEVYGVSVKIMETEDKKFILRKDMQR